MKPDELLSDREQEQAVLGILLEGADIPAALKREHFLDPACLTVFDTIQELAKRGRPADLVSVLDALKTADTLERVGGGLYVDALVERAPVKAHLDYHLGRLDVTRKRRLVHRAAVRMETAAQNPDLDSSEALNARTAEIVADMAEADHGNLGVIDAAAWLETPLPEPEQVLRGAFDLNTKTCICGPSKARKSFFLLQAAVSLSAGLPAFLAWHIDRPRTVLHVNLEIPEAHFQKRLRRMVKALTVAPNEIRGRLHIMNARGAEAVAVLPRIVAEAKRIKAEVVILDPIYKLVPGDESKQENVKALLSTMDRICEATGAALVYVHHGTKGEAGDRLTIDRAAGSGVLARDVDCLVSLVNHVEDGFLVVEQIARSYAPREAFTIRWDMEADCFRVEDGIAPAVRTSFNRKRTGNGKTVTDENIVALVEGNPLTSAAFIESMKGLGLAKDAARRTMDRLVDDGKLQAYRTNTWPTRVYFGTKDGIERMKSESSKP